MKKVCKKCKIEYPISQFTRDKELKDGHKNECHLCRRQRETLRYRNEIIPFDTKTCPICEQNLPVIKFKIEHKNEDSLSSICIPCARDKENLIKSVHKIDYTCSICGKSKSGDKFPTNRAAFTTIYATCKECVSEKRHSEGRNIAAAIWKRSKLETDPLFVESLRESHKKSHNECPEKRMLQQSGSRARTRLLDHNIDISDIIIPELCPILGIPFILGEKGNYEFTPSLDRIDNSKGYVKGNVQVITKKANSMKNSGTPEELAPYARDFETETPLGMALDGGFDDFESLD